MTETRNVNVGHICCGLGAGAKHATTTRLVVTDAGRALLQSAHDAGASATVASQGAVAEEAAPASEPASVELPSADAGDFAFDDDDLEAIEADVRAATEAAQICAGAAVTASASDLSATARRATAEAIQGAAEGLDCFVASAPRNDGELEGAPWVEGDPSECDGGAWDRLPPLVTASLDDVDLSGEALAETDDLAIAWPSYDSFLEDKIVTAPLRGIEVAREALHPYLKPHCKDLTVWALRLGCAAIFASFGLHKTAMQLEWCRQLVRHTGQPSLCVVPLGVRHGFIKEALLLDMDVRFIRTTDELNDLYCEGVRHFLTNYESVREGKLDPNQFEAVTLDEASVLRSYGSKTFQEFLPLFAKIPYKLVATATPSPNRYKELIHYAGFLGVMDTGLALAQPLDARVLTPGGWKLMGHLKVGDDVIAGDGTPTVVLGVYPQGIRAIYKVTFSDGSSTECTEDHLWLTRTRNERDKRRREPYRVRTTAEIRQSLQYFGQLNHAIPIVGPVQFDARPVAIDPWLLGVLIGDANFGPSRVMLTSADQWIVDHAKPVIGAGLEIKKSGRLQYLICGASRKVTGRGRHSNVLLNAVRAYNLSGKRAWEKSVPREYLFNSIEVRIAILRGLMDSDGHAPKVKRDSPRFVTTSEQLAKDVQFLARSLGGEARITKHDRNPRRAYVVTVRMPIGMNPFSLPRKAVLWVPSERLSKLIESIELVGEKQAQCIAVAHPERLYVTDDMIVTHNTRWFQRNSEKAGDLTLYEHKAPEFWMWVHSWAAFLQKPSELGYSDDGYELPPLKLTWHEVPADHSKAEPERDGQGVMFRDVASSLPEAARARRDSLPARVAKMMAIIAQDPESHRIIWHDLEAEREAIEQALPGVVTIMGSMDIDAREARLADFEEGRIKHFGTKPILSGSGSNFQYHCHKAIYVALPGYGYKFNDFIQSLYRLQRFGQAHPVEVDIIYAEDERQGRAALEEKWARDGEMRARMSEIIKAHGLNTLPLRDALLRTLGVQRVEVAGANFIAINNDAITECRMWPDNSVDEIITSIPFSNHYEYSASYRDLGHTDDNGHFWGQMDFLSCELLRMLKPGRLACIHVKDRVLFGSVTGEGVPTLSPFHAEAIMHYRAHGFQYMGMIHVNTDVVTENAGNYRLGWSENCKDSTKMGVGSPEYVLLLRKRQSDRTRGYADTPVTKQKWEGEGLPADVDADGYSRARWQIDAHSFWRSSGNRLLTPDEFAGLGPRELAKIFSKVSVERIYDYEAHVRIGENLERQGALPSEWMAIAPGATAEHTWHDVVRMRTLNTMQAQKGREKHICPLQFDIVDRLIERYSNPGDLIFDPFGGLMTVPYRALLKGRKGAATELSATYFLDGVKYLQMAEDKMATPQLFDLAAFDAVNTPPSDEMTEAET